MKIRPRNWGTFQHYKDRSPPWIKLHKTLLDDFEFQRLPVASRALAPMLWLLASEKQDGWIEADSDRLAFRLRVQVAEIESALTPLIEGGFFESDSKTLAPRKRAAMPEERRGEGEDSSKEANASLDAKVLGGGSEKPKTPPTGSDGVMPISNEAPTTQVWRAYSGAYEAVYGVAPVRNAKVNGQLAQFITRISMSEAPAVAAWFLRSKNRLYVNAKHPVDLLLRDAEKLRTEWATGTNGTATEAALADRAGHTGATFSKLIQEAEHDGVENAA